VHRLGLKLGAYLDAGTATCQGLPGSGGRFDQDAATLAAWGVDFVKVDFCNTGMPPPAPLYAQIHDAFAAVSRPIMLSVCEWGFQNPWEWASLLASMWRTTSDYTHYGAPLDYWHATLKMVDLNARLASYAHPGAWNDPDMLLAGTGLLTLTQSRAQFSLWAMMAAPLLMDADLLTIPADGAAILSNPEVIAVDQDPAGIQGVRLAGGSHQLWVRQLADGSRAVLMFNSGQYATTMSVDLGQLGLRRRRLYAVRDLWARRTWLTGGPLSTDLEPDAVAMFRVAPVLPRPRPQGSRRAT
jgi:alpha-galactosidase